MQIFLDLDDTGTMYQIKPHFPYPFVVSPYDEGLLKQKLRKTIQQWISLESMKSAPQNVINPFWSF